MEVRALNSEESKARDAGIALAAELLCTSAPFTAENVQTLYDASRDYPENDKATIALGVAFGEMIASKAGFEWVRIIDQYGEETGLCHPAKLVVCFPISMVKKRVANGDATVIAELCDATISAVNDAAATGSYDTR